MTMYINPTDTHTHTTASAHHTLSLRLSCLGKEVSLKRRSERLNVICHHSVSHHMFAGDTELYKSDSPSEAFTLARTIESCVSDVKVWVVQNKLPLNDDKTEILLIGSAPGIDLPFSLCVGHSDISFFLMRLVTLVSFLTASLL